MEHIKKYKDFIQKTAGNGTHTLNENNLSATLEAMEECLRSFFKGRKPSISPSGTNITPRQMKLIMEGKMKHNPDQFKYNARLKMLLASLAEHMNVFLMKEAGLDIANEQRTVKVDIIHDGEKVGDMRGSNDYTLNGQVRDFKCSNAENFAGSHKDFKGNKIKAKWSSPSTLSEQDHFGYRVQGFIYDLGASKEGWSNGFSGWDVFNLNTGEIKSVNAKSIMAETEMEYDQFCEMYSDVKEASSFEEFPYCEDLWTDSKGRERLHWKCVRCQGVEACFPNSKRIEEGTSVMRIVE